MFLKRFMGYLFYTLFVGVFVYWGVIYGQNLKIQSNNTFSPYPYYQFISFFPIIIGMILALPRLIFHIQQKGKWVLDWQLLLPVGLSTLLINISILNNNFSLFRYGWFRLIATDTRIYDISGIICGYILLSSLIRTTSTNDTDIKESNSKFIEK